MHPLFIREGKKEFHRRNISGLSLLLRQIFWRITFSFQNPEQLSSARGMQQPLRERTEWVQGKEWWATCCGLMLSGNCHIWERAHKKPEPQTTNGLTETNQGQAHFAAHCQNYHFYSTFAACSCPRWFFANVNALSAPFCLFGSCRRLSLLLSSMSAAYPVSPGEITASSLSWLRMLYVSLQKHLGNVNLYPASNFAHYIIVLWSGPEEPEPAGASASEGRDLISSKHLRQGVPKVELELRVLHNAENLHSKNSGRCRLPDISVISVPFKKNF